MRIVYILLLVPCVLFAQPSNDVIPLRFLSSSGTARFDSLSASLEIDDTDTTGWIGITDSLASAGGYAAAFYTEEDSVSATIRIQWSTYDGKTCTGATYLTMTQIDSLVSGYHAGATRNPVTAQLCFRKPVGATRLRFLISTGQSVGQFPVGSGLKRIPRVRGHIIRLK
jgi:hypothetical protein